MSARSLSHVLIIVILLSGCANRYVEPRFEPPPKFGTTSQPSRVGVVSDLFNPNVSVVEAILNALEGGMAIDDVVTTMLKADQSQYTLIIASAIIVSPGHAEAIVTAAIKAGVSPASVVAIVLVAMEGVNTSGIIKAAVVAAPPDARDGIIQAAVAMLPANAAGVSAKLTPLGRILEFFSLHALKRRLSDTFGKLRPKEYRLIPTFDVLYPDQMPSKEYFVYGLILLSGKPSDENEWRRNLDICEAMTSELVDYNRPGRFTTSATFVATYWMVNEDVSIIGCKDLIEHYDYLYAAELLGELDLLEQRGPILATYNSLFGIGGQPELLIIDMSFYQKKQYFSQLFRMWEKRIAQPRERWLDGLTSDLTLLMGKSVLREYGPEFLTVTKDVLTKRLLKSK